MLKNMKPNWAGIGIACGFAIGAAVCFITGHSDLASELGKLALAQAILPAVHSKSE